jgi:hypothetical protein
MTDQAMIATAMLFLTAYKLISQTIDKKRHEQEAERAALAETRALEIKAALEQSASKQQMETLIAAQKALEGVPAQLQESKEWQDQHQQSNDAFEVATNKSIAAIDHRTRRVEKDVAKLLPQKQRPKRASASETE